MTLLLALALVALAAAVAHASAAFDVDLSQVRRRSAGGSRSPTYAAAL